MRLRFCLLFLSVIILFPVHGQDLRSLMDTTGMFDLVSPLQKRKKPINDEQSSLRRLKMAIDRNNQHSVAANSGNLGYIYMGRGDYAKALQFFSQSLKANEKLNAVKAQSVSLAQIGIVYMRQQNYDKAFPVLTHALQLMKQESFVAGIGPAASYAGQCATRLQQYEKAKELYQVALNAYQSSSNEPATGNIYNLIGQLYLINDDYDQALQNLNKAFAIASKGNNNTRKAVVQRDIGLVYFKKGMIEKALDYFNRSNALDKQLLVAKLKKEALMKLFTIYSFNKDFNKADVFHEQYRAIKDSIDGVNQKFGSEEERVNDLSEKENIIAMLERKSQEQQLMTNQKELELSAQITATDIERRNKEKALEELHMTSEEMEKITKEKALKERDLARKELQLSRQKSFRNLLISGMAIIIVLAYFIYNRYRTNKITNARLAKANEELASTLSELRRTQDQLIHSEKLASLGQMTAGIAHEIKNPLNFISNFSSVSVDILKELNGTNDAAEQKEIIRDVQQNLEKIVEHSRRADGIVKNMLLHSRRENPEKKITDLNRLIEESYQLAYHAMQTRHPSFKVTVQFYLDHEVPSIPLQQQEIERVFINILDNAFYAMMKKQQKNDQYEPVITILSGVKQNNVNIKISDNADGIPAAIIKNIFQPFFTTKPAGEGTGLGLSLCYDIITKAHSGVLDVKSEEGKGTVFTIQLPVT